jgi:hypothetical protein
MMDKNHMVISMAFFYAEDYVAKIQHPFMTKSQKRLGTE